MQFDAIEACGNGVLRSGCEVGDDARDLVRLQRARTDEVDRAMIGVVLAIDGDGRWRNRLDARRQQHRNGDATAMEELRKDAAARVMHGFGDGLPALDLCL